MGAFFLTVLYQPLYNLLVFVHNLAPWGGLGLAIILVTLIIKGILLPLNYRQLKAQKDLQEIQPKLAELKEKHKDSQEELGKAMMALYKGHNVNPFASCLPAIVQAVIFIALYKVLSDGIGTIKSNLLYSFVTDPGTMNHFLFGIDLSHVSVPLGLIAAVLQYFMARQMITSRPPKQVAGQSASLDEDMAATMNKMMLYFLPVVIGIVCSTQLAAGLTVYIIVSTLVSTLLSIYFLRRHAAKT